MRDRSGSGPARHGPAEPAPPTLFSDRSCPFAHRVLALVEHLGCPLDVRESMVGDKPEGIYRHSVSGRIPLLVHGALVLSESRVMLEYLADLHGLTDALPPDLRTRTLHRHAMAVVDEFLAPRLLHPTQEVEPRLEDVLRALEEVATPAPGPSLLELHVAPIWLRFQMWWPNGPITSAIEGRPALRAWLDAAIALDCVVRTAPDPVAHMEDVERARQAGLMSA